MKYVETGRGSMEENVHVRGIFPGFDAFVVNGHTDAMMIPHIRYKRRTVVFMADLLPSTHHIPIPWVMGYDTRPLLTIREKDAFLNEAVEKDYVLFFEHDAHTECCTVQATEKGVRVKDTFKLADL